MIRLTESGPCHSWGPWPLTSPQQKKVRRDSIGAQLPSILGHRLEEFAPGLIVGNTQGCKTIGQSVSGTPCHDTAHSWSTGTNEENLREERKGSQEIILTTCKHRDLNFMPYLRQHEAQRTQQLTIINVNHWWYAHVLWCTVWRESCVLWPKLTLYNTLIVCILPYLLEKSSLSLCF